MGKYARQKKKNKCKGIGEIEAMEVAHDVGVRTRARALSVAAAASSRTAKNRKVRSGRESKSSTTSLIQLRSRRRPASPAASRCSSNACSDVGGGSAKVVDLEDAGFQIETSTCNFRNRGRRETTPSSENQAESADLESMARPTEANSSSAGVMPSEIELDEFFAAADKDLQKRFTDKYNYDVANDVPLGGRFEWIQLKP